MSSCRPTDDVVSSLLQRAPAIPKNPGARQQEASPDATSTLLIGPELLALAAALREAQRAAMKDKTYRSTPIGGEVGHFMRKLRFDDAAENTLLAYESTLSKLALDFAHRELADLTIEDLRDFFDEHWGESKANTRRRNLAAVKSFFTFCCEERGLEANPVEKIKPPKKTDVHRNAYSPDIIEQLRAAQPTLRDQIGMQLLGRLGLRCDELRRIQIGHFNLIHGTVQVRAKGGHTHVVPLAYDTLKADVEIHAVGREAKEYLLYPKRHVDRPLSRTGIWYWFKDALKRAGLPETIKMHEMRHSAADNLYRHSGDIVQAKQLLRHRSVGTTEAYLHPSMDDLAAAMAAMGDERSE